MAKRQARKTRHGDRSYYVYGLLDPRDDSIFYIGKGRGRRATQHVWEWRRYGGAVDTSGLNHRKLKRIAEVLEDGKLVGISILHAELTEAEAFRLERDEIARRGLDTLTNISPGVRHELERAYEDLMLGFKLTRTAYQWLRAFIMKNGRAPSRQDWQTYFDIFPELVQLRGWLENELKKVHVKEKTEADPGDGRRD